MSCDWLEWCDIHFLLRSCAILTLRGLNTWPTFCVAENFRGLNLVEKLIFVVNILDNNAQVDHAHSFK